MKPLKKAVKAVKPSPEIQLPAANHQPVQSIMQKLKPKRSRSLSKKDLQEIFIILTEDIPPEILSKLLETKKGIIASPEDDILQRLLKLEKDYHYLQALSLTDELTGLYNKRFFDKQLKIEISRSKRTGQPFCLMFIDLDNFKSVNDTLGHRKGDEFLINLSRQICLKIRPTDFACRYGGDEFVIIMPATHLVDGISIAQRWHDLIKQVASQMELIDLKVSSSIGIDEFDSSSLFTAEEFLERVDKELYKAKNTGKNKVSHPGRYLQLGKAKEKFVTVTEKHALYKGSAAKKGKLLRSKN